MKKFRNPIFARVVLLYLFFSLSFSTQRAYAQFVVSDPLNLVQNLLQSGYQLIMQLNEVKSFVQDSAFYDALKAVANGVKTYKKVDAIIDSQKWIVKSAVDNLNNFRNNPSLNPTQISGMVKMYGYFIDQSAKNVKELQKLINPNILSMSDGERMGVIDKIQLDVKELEVQLNYYNNMNAALTSQQQMAKIDMDKMQAFYDSQITPVETEVGAVQKIGGFHGQIANLLYAISAIMALIGAVRIYGMWTRGDEVYQAIGTWFSAVLVSVFVITFVKQIFF